MSQLGNGISTTTHQNNKIIISTDYSKNLYLSIASIPFIISLFLALFILIFFQFLPPKLPLFYSLPWGNAQFANHQQFFIIPATITLVNLLNLTIIWHLHNQQKFFKNMLILASLTVTLIFLITFIKIFLIFA